VPSDFVRNASAIIEFDASKHSTDLRASRECFTIQAVARHIGADNRVNMSVFKKINMVETPSVCLRVRNDLTTKGVVNPVALVSLKAHG